MIAAWKFTGSEQIVVDGVVHNCVICDSEDGLAISDAFDGTPHVDDPENQCPMCGSMISSSDGIYGRHTDIRFNVPYEVKVGMVLSYSQYVCGSIVAWWVSKKSEPTRMAAVEWPPPLSCMKARQDWMNEVYYI